MFIFNYYGAVNVFHCIVYVNKNKQNKAYEQSTKPFCRCLLLETPQGDSGQGSASGEGRDFVGSGPESGSESQHICNESYHNCAPLFVRHDLLNAQLWAQYAFSSS